MLRPPLIFQEPHSVEEQDGDKQNQIKLTEFIISLTTFSIFSFQHIKNLNLAGTLEDLMQSHQNFGEPEVALGPQILKIFAYTV